jgi:hypothetical protein
MACLLVIFPVLVSIAEKNLATLVRNVGRDIKERILSVLLIVRSKRMFNFRQSFLG